MYISAGTLTSWRLAHLKGQMAKPALLYRRRERMHSCLVHFQLESKPRRWGIYPSGEIEMGIYLVSPNKPNHHSSGVPEASWGYVGQAAAWNGQVTGPRRVVRLAGSTPGMVVMVPAQPFQAPFHWAGRHVSPQYGMKTAARETGMGALWKQRGPGAEVSARGPTSGRGDGRAESP